MATLTYQKTATASYLVGFAGIIAMPDVLFELLVELSHLMLELAHYLFEIFESTLDHLVEHIFETEPRETQIIVFYLIVSMAIGGFYCLCRAMPRFLHKIKESLFGALLQRKTRLLQYWGESASNKFKMIAIFHVGLTFVVLFGF
jgi:hypothetical protein